MIKNNFDVVNTVRNKRPGETFLRINFIKFLYFVSKILFTKITFNSGDFRLVNSKAKNKIIKVKNKVFFLRSINCIKDFIDIIEVLDKMEFQNVTLFGLQILPFKLFWLLLILISSKNIIQNIKLTKSSNILKKFSLLI